MVSIPSTKTIARQKDCQGGKVMLALKVTQKDGTFYLVNYKAQDLLRRVKFLNRHYRDGEADKAAEGKVRPEEEDVVNFIKGVEKKDSAFQRGLIKRKVRAIAEFYKNAGAQPLIPGPVLLYTPEPLEFEPMKGYESLGNLSEPTSPFIIIDGQHRLAGLHVYSKKNPEEAARVEVPAIIFDKRQEEFAPEMFVIINSTHTRINRSHLVDLMENVTFGTSDEKKWAAWVVKCLYEDGRSPLQYRIDRLGGRSRQDKWILQSELFNEVHRLVDPQRRTTGEEAEEKGMAGKAAGSGGKKADFRDFVKHSFSFDRRGHQAPDMFIDYLKAVQDVMGDAWGNRNSMVTTAVSLKAFVRAFGDLMGDEALRAEWLERRDPACFKRRIAPWKEMVPEFRKDGFYERFAAKGQVERVRRIHTELVRKVIGGYEASKSRH